MRRRAVVLIAVLLITATLAPSLRGEIGAQAENPSRQGTGPTGRWSLLSKPPPVLQGTAAGRGYSAIWDAARERVLIFGGRDSSFVLSGLLWSYEPAGDRWRLLDTREPGPFPRATYSAAWDPQTEAMLVFGEMHVPFDDGSVGSSSELWVYRAREERWVRLEPEGPRPGAWYSHAAVWDPVRRQMLVFGGSTSDGRTTRANSALWAYRPDANVWEELAPVPFFSDGGSIRFAPVAMWEPIRSELLVFPCCSDAVWRYLAHENAWIRMEQVGLRGQTGISLFALWDPVGGQTLVGSGANAVRRLWSFEPDAGAWRLLAAGEGPLNWQRQAVWDEPRSRLLLLPGSPRDGLSGSDVWAYTPTSGAWARLNAARESLQGNLMIDRVSGDLFVSAGIFTTGFPTPFQGGIWRLQRADQWAPRLLSKRDLAQQEGALSFVGSATLDTVNRAVYLFGGAVSGDPRAPPRDQRLLWRYQLELDEWAAIDAEGRRPPARRNHSAVWEDGRERLLIFGGGRTFGDLWEFDPVSGDWTELNPNGPRPAARRDHSAAWDVAGQRMLVFGGTSGNQALADLWAYEPEGNRWTELGRGQGPEARYGHGAVWDPLRNRLLVYGGYTPRGHPERQAPGLVWSREVWEYQAETDRWAEVIAGGPRLSARSTSAVWDPIGDQMLLLVDGDIWAFRSD